MDMNGSFENRFAFEDVLYWCDESAKPEIGAIGISGAFNMFPQGTASCFKKEAEQTAARNETKTIVTGILNSPAFDKRTGFIHRKF